MYSTESLFKCYRHVVTLKKYKLCLSVPPKIILQIVLIRPKLSQSINMWCRDNNRVFRTRKHEN